MSKLSCITSNLKLEINFGPKVKSIAQYKKKTVNFFFSFNFLIEIKIPFLSLLSLSSILSIHFCSSPTTANSLHFKAIPPPSLCSQVLPAQPIFPFLSPSLPISKNAYNAWIGLLHLNVYHCFLFSLP